MINITQLNASQNKPPLTQMRDKFKSGEQNNFNSVSFKAVPSGCLKAYVFSKPCLSFGRTLEEHKSWGLNHDSTTGKTSVKIWAPDAKKLTIQYAAYNENEKLFWDIKNPKMPETTKNAELTTRDGKVYTLNDPDVQKELKPGMMYRFVIENKDGHTYYTPDYYSKSQPCDTLGWSQVAKRDFDWEGHGHFPLIDNPAKLNICELHVGTFSKDHDFKGLQRQAEELKRKGYNAVQLMPVNSFYSGGLDYKKKKSQPQDWGYNLQFLNAIQQSYGGLENYKESIKILHKAGLRVKQDLVFNHVSHITFEDENKPAKGFNAFDKDMYEIPIIWGPRPVYNNEHIRHAAIDTSLFFLDECQVDGLRLDSINNILPEGTNKGSKELIHEIDRKFLKEMVIEIKQHAPHAIIVPEYENRFGIIPSEGINTYAVAPINFTPEQLRILKNDTEKRNKGLDPDDHTKVVKQINSIEPMGFDAVLGIDDPHHAIQLIVQNRHDRILKLLDPGNQKEVSFLTGCHDNISGDFYREDGEERHIVRYAQAFANVDAKTAINFLRTEYQKDNTGIKHKYNSEADLRIQKEIQQAKAAFRLIRAVQSLSSGPILTYAGDESASITPLKFMFTDAGQKEDGELVREKIIKEKGYDAADPTLLDKCTIEKSPLESLSIKNKKLERLSIDLAKVREENSAITSKNVDNDHHKLFLNKEGGVAMLYRKSDTDNNEILAYLNLNKEKSYIKEESGSYKVHEFNYNTGVNEFLPEGKWELVINTDAKEYAGTGTENKKYIQVSQNKRPEINLAPYSALIYRKIK